MNSAADAYRAAIAGAADLRAFINNTAGRRIYAQRGNSGVTCYNEISGAHGAPTVAASDLLGAAYARAWKKHSAALLADTLLEADAIVAERRAAAVKEAQDFLADALLPKREQEAQP